MGEIITTHYQPWFFAKENAQGHRFQGSSENKNPRSWRPDLGRHLSRGFHWAASVTSALAKQRYQGLSAVAQREAHYTDPGTTLKTMRHAKSKQSAWNSTVCPLHIRERTGNFPESRRCGNWDEKAAAVRMPKTSQWRRCLDHVLPAAGPRMEQGQRGDPEASCPQGSKEERGHNSNPK